MALFDEVKEVLISQLAIKSEMVKPESHVVDDLGADSMDALEIVAALEEKFNVSISQDEAKQITTVTSIVDLVENKIRSKGANLSS